MGTGACSNQDPFKPLLPVQIRIKVGSGVSPRRSSTATSPGSRSTTPTAGGSAIEVSGMDATAADEPSGEGQGVAATCRTARSRRAIFGDNAIIPMVDVASPVLTDPTGTTIQRGDRHPLPAAARARATGSTATSSPSRCSGVDQGYLQDALALRAARRRPERRARRGRLERLRLRDPLRRGEADEGEGERARLRATTRHSPATPPRRSSSRSGSEGTLCARLGDRDRLAVGPRPHPERRPPEGGAGDRRPLRVGGRRLGDGRPRRRAPQAGRPRERARCRAACSTGRTS